MVCSECKAVSPDGKKFCGECGRELKASDAVAVPGGDGELYCAKHIKTVTRLRCGRCEAPICPKCTVYTPAGTRCRPCSKNKIALRPAGVLHSAVGLAANAGPGIGRRVWYLALWYLILSFLRGPFE